MIMPPSTLPAYDNLNLEEVQKILDDKNASRLNLCLINRIDSAPWVMRPEPVFLLSELAKSGPRILNRTEKFLLSNLPGVGFISSSYTSPEKIPMHGIEDGARKATYSFYY
ncbi:MAG: hypothetical protein AABX93_00150 [Nanoarchaeota archaeon]